MLAILLVTVPGPRTFSKAIDAGALTLKDVVLIVDAPAVDQVEDLHTASNQGTSSLSDTYSNRETAALCHLIGHEP